MPRELHVAATADIHSPQYMGLFEDALSSLPRQLDLLILAGDIVLRGQYRQIVGVLETIRRFYDGRILACFGNEEFENVKSRLIELTQLEIIWLSESSYTITTEGMSLGLVGSKGCLDRPTRWQSDNIPNIRQQYDYTQQRIEAELLKLRTDFKLLFTHYAPTYGTLTGEPQPAWPEMGCLRLEKTLGKTRPMVAIHGHAHKSNRLMCHVDGVPVINVSLPAQHGIPVITVPYQPDTTHADLQTFIEGEA